VSLPLPPPLSRSLPPPLSRSLPRSLPPRSLPRSWLLPVALSLPPSIASAAFAS